MSDPFIAEIRIFPYSFAPNNWAFCNGQLLPIGQNAALFSIIGNRYGGNGTSNFALPNLQASCAVGAGQAPGMQLYKVGQVGGVNSVTIAPAQGVAHTHAFKCVNPLAGDSTGNKPDPTMAVAKAVGILPYETAAAPVTMNAKAIGPSNPPAGVTNPQPHENRMPYLTLNFCIALAGILPKHST